MADTDWHLKHLQRPNRRGQQYSQYVALHDPKEDISTNPTNNKPFAAIVSKAVERGTVLKGSLTAAAGYLAPAALLGFERSWSDAQRGTQPAALKPDNTCPGQVPIAKIENQRHGLDVCTRTL